MPSSDRASKTGIKVIVVGGGFGGLATAIECHRQGHDVEVFEQAKEFLMLGDLIALSPNAARVVSKWGDVLPRITKRCVWAKQLAIHDRKGELLHVQNMILENNGSPFCNAHRAFLQECFVDYTVSLGIPIHMNTRVEQFFEDSKSAGITVNGHKHHADVVIGADGIHSRCRVHITKKEKKPTSSGFAIYRAWVPLDALGDNPYVQDIKHGGDTMQLWIGPDTHGFVAVCSAMNCLAWFLTHPDTNNVQESYSNPGKVEEVLEIMKGWDPRFTEVVKSTPKDSLIDWKLLFRDPVKKWVSDTGRIAVLGDAAHPFLPTSGNGASQALEDAATIAVTLRLAGEGSIPLATKAFETLRYERVTLCQRNGFDTRHRWHKIDWKGFQEDPNSINLPQPDWLYGHDAEQYAFERWEDAKAHLKEGKEFKSTNTFEGHVHEDWTVENVLKMEKEVAKPPAAYTTAVRARL